MDEVKIEKSRVWQSHYEPEFGRDNMLLLLGDSCVYPNGEGYAKKLVVADTDVVLIPGAQTLCDASDTATFGSVGKYKIAISRFSESALADNWHGGSWAAVQATGVNDATVYSPLVLTGYNADAKVVYTDRPSTDVNDFTQIYATKLVEIAAQNTEEEEEEYIPRNFIINVVGPYHNAEKPSDNFGAYLADRTPNEVLDAVMRGDNVVCEFNYNGMAFDGLDPWPRRLQLAQYSSNMKMFRFSGICTVDGAEQLCLMEMTRRTYNGQEFLRIDVRASWLKTDSPDLDFENQWIPV